jgi:fibro-slime domain-containing protein
MGERECSYPCAPFQGADYACTATTRYYDGDPLFFPLDDVTSAEPRYTATIPPAYGRNFEFEPGGALHNFYFTTEVRFRARYSETNSVQLGVSADDDAWLFVNDRLALDAGGKHTPLDGYTLVTVAPFAETFGLSEGDIYELVLFHADRSANGSSLSFFMTALDHVPSCMRTN